MSAIIPSLEFPELFFGFVAPVGTDISGCIQELSEYFRRHGYNVVELKVTDVFKGLTKFLPANDPLVDRPLDKRYFSYIKYGNRIRGFFEDDSALAAITLARIIAHRGKSPNSKFVKNVYLINQFKRPEEVELFRSVYGRLFFQISVYSRRGARVEHLSRKIAESANSASPNPFRSSAELIMNADEHETKEDHGQRVSKIFHDGDFIVNTDISTPSVKMQVERFCDLLFGSNQISPTKDEYGMFIAKAAALRTLDLSRQVGAAIFSREGEIIALGSNEVPKAGGGTYWAGEQFDDREFVRKEDSNDKRKNELLSELIELLAEDNPGINIKSDLADNSQFMDALEYGRIIHAEMSSICDAARLGRTVKDAILFSTTFPCHMCAKHIIAAGISRVVFLEPYPKSLAADLHGDSLQIEEADRGKYKNYPFVEFMHFFGVSPRRYREIFERGTRKDKKTGKLIEWKYSSPRPLVEIKIPVYAELEKIITENYVGRYLEAISADPSILST